MSAPITIIVNASSGGEKDAALLKDLDDAIRRHRLDARVEQAESGEEIERLARRALDQGCGTIVAGGGDGTISAIAGMVAGTDITFGVLPFGTLNHFAKDLGIPLEIDGAVRVLAEGHTIRADVGEVNGRVFVNNSSLGLYPHIVRHREQQQERLGRSKWVALAWATLTMLGRYPSIDVHISTDGKEIITRTPLVFIGNNEYSIDGFTIGTRKHLTDGMLSLYIPHRAGKLKLFWFALRALVGRLREAGEFDATSVTEILISTRQKSIHVAVDGEVVTMQTPLRYRIRPGALRVVVPLPATDDHTNTENQPAAEPAGL